MQPHQKNEVPFLLQLGNNVAKPYLFIGGLPKRKPNSFLGKLRLRIAIKIFLKEYNRSQESRVLFLLGKCFQSLKNHEEALNYFRKVWDIDPFNPILFKEISTTCLELGKYEEGLRYAQKEVSEFPDNPESRANLAFFLFKNDRLTEARKMIKETYVKAKDNDFVKRMHNSIIT